LSAVQREICALRIPDPIVRARFIALLTNADALIFQAVEMRREAWREYRAAILEASRSANSEIGQYA
jgi:hypothetical protein